MPSVRCPFCKVSVSENSSSYQTLFVNSYSANSNSGHDDGYCGQFRVLALDCPECGKVSFTAARSANAYAAGPDAFNVPIYPQVPDCEHFPEYVPQAIRNDYEEAHAILNISPKSSATLCRRCLQGMIHDFWEVHEKNLNAEITALKDKVPAAQWRALDALRGIGNIGAHMEHDVNLIIDIEPEEAVKLLRLIELLIRDWYIARHEQELLYEEIAGIGVEKQHQRGKT